MSRRSWLLVIVAVFAMVAVSVPSFAQVGTAGAQLTGTVRDATGGAVTKATVTLRDMDTNRSYVAITNDSGLYILASVSPGRYELTVEETGFAKFVQSGVVMTVGEMATADVSLKVASGAEQVTVTTETPVIEPTKTEISQVVEPRQIESLPINGRLFTDFALLTPGVSLSRTSLGTSFTDYQTTQISFGGMRSFSNMVAVDGADFVNQMTGVQRFTPPQESVQEFRVVNNSFGAEFGRAAGGIVNIVTKSGTNNIHGSVYEYLQNSATDARSLLQPAPLPHELRQNQFGGTLGGPIRKDKTFFFVNYEGKRRAESPTYPPDLVNNLQLIDDTKAVLGLAPEGCFTGLSSCNGSPASYLNSFLKTENDDWGFVRLDHQIGSNHHLGVRYNVEDTRGQGLLVGQTLDGGGIGTPSGGRDLFVRDQSVFATLDSSLKSNLINSALVQYARRHYNFPGMTGQPDFSLLNDLELGHNFGTDDRKYESRAQFTDSLSWIKGNHVWKFGFDGNYVWENDVFPGFTPVRPLIPAAGFTPIDCLANFAAFYANTYGVALPADVAQAGSPATTGCPVKADNGVVFVYAGVPLPTDPTACSATACLPVVTATNNPLNTSTWANAYQPSLFSNYGKQINHGYWAGFFQDQWRITRKLTFNYGVRWEYESGLTTWIKPDYKGVQPRVGLAYSPDNKTVIRAGFGIFDDAYNLVFFFVPNTQKVVPGYLCDNQPPAAIVAACAIVTPQQLPMINSQQASQGYQLYAHPASQGAAAITASVINTGGYQAFENPPTFPNPGMLEMAGTCFTNGACGVGAGGMDHNARIPYSEQASLEIDRQFGGGFALSLNYLFVGAHKFVRGNNINIPCPIGTNKSAAPTDPLPEWMPGMLDANGAITPCAGNPTLGTGALAGLGPWFGGALGSGLQTVSAGLLDYNNDVANAVYHGFTVTGLERIGTYFTLNANYTYSHTLDDGNFTTFVNLPVNQFDYKAERANSNQDLRHRFVANFTANTPTKGWYRNFLFSSIVTLETGRPFSIFYGANTLNDLAGGATDRVGGAPFFGGATGSSGCPAVQACETMIPRNTYFGDSLRSWDLRLTRNFHVREKQELALSIDAFNVLNRPNVDEITPVYGSPVFCGNAIPQRYNDATSLAIQHGGVTCPVGDGLAIPGQGSFASTPITTAAGQTCLPPSATCIFIPASPNATFGLPRTMFNARQFQFAAKYTF
jgi:outer membrane receptor protein involved in Fe transport